MSVLVKERMQKYPFITDAQLSVQHAIKLMQDCNIRHLPVMSEDQIIGIVSHRDLLQGLSSPKGAETPVGQVMTEDVYTVAPGEDLEDVTYHMARKKIGCAIVANEKNQVIGIFTVTDALYLLSELLKEDHFKQKILPVENFMSQLEYLAI